MTAQLSYWLYSEVDGAGDCLHHRPLTMPGVRAFAQAHGLTVGVDLHLEVAALEEEEEDIADDDTEPSAPPVVEAIEPLVPGTPWRTPAPVVEVIPEPAARIHRKGFAAAVDLMPSTAEVFADSELWFSGDTPLNSYGVQALNRHLTEHHAQPPAAEACLDAARRIESEERNHLDMDARALRFGHDADGLVTLHGRDRYGVDLGGTLLSREGFANIAARFGALHTGGDSAEAALAPGARYLLGRNDAGRIVSNANADMEAFATNWTDGPRSPYPSLRLHTRVRPDGRREVYAATSERYHMGTAAALTLRLMAQQLRGTAARGVVEYDPDTTTVEARFAVAPGVEHAGRGKVGEVYTMGVSMKTNDAGKGGGSFGYWALCARCINLTTITHGEDVLNWRHNGGDAYADAIRHNLIQGLRRFDAVADAYLEDFGVLHQAKVADVPIKLVRGKPVARGVRYENTEEAIRALAPSKAAATAALDTFALGLEEDRGTWGSVVDAFSRAPQVPDAAPTWWREVEELSGLLVPVVAGYAR